MKLKMNQCLESPLLNWINKKNDGYYINSSTWSFGPFEDKETAKIALEEVLEIENYYNHCCEVGSRISFIEDGKKIPYCLKYNRLEDIPQFREFTTKYNLK
ncbi:MAG: hypothetical protein PHF86_08950 [Candidatus Nanoarchaeia archaeon]|nr:hypothetical protein [Candidatus Nanoarchaeia archaeon]